MNRILGLLQKNWFLIGVLTAVVCGFIAPNTGVALNPSSLTTTLLVIVLFLIAGVTLPSEEILHGLKDVRLHIYIQSFIFVVTPLFFLATSQVLNQAIDERLRVGVYALACLPTTISSCIVFTQVSGGNVAGTIFNASLANVLGILVSPLLLSLFLQGGVGRLPAEDTARILKSLVLKMLVPIIAGQALRIFIKGFVSQQKKRIGIASNSFILLIIFFAVSKAAVNPAFQEHLSQVPVPFAYLAVANVVLVCLAYLGARLLRFSRENIITVVYAAPQKTLALGVPLVTTYFATRPEILAAALLPLLFYHPWQLLIAGIVRNIARRSEAHTADSGR